jgi:alginate O-acetyltransferase complex protein AlgI
MLFNSLEFLIFFPLVTAIYFLLPHKFRWLHLLIASCIFYAAFVPVYILILLFTIVIDYFAGLMIENSAGSTRRLYLTLSILANVGVLAFFKYFNFLSANWNELVHLLHLKGANSPVLNILLPIGLSFHTFQAMSYTIEVYRGNQKAERHFGIYALYVMFYPQLVAGPIERPQNMLHQFYEKHSFNYLSVTSGLKIALWGLFKKVVIADRLALFTAPVLNHPHNYPAITLLIAVFFFTFQIFCDFSGYSDIAIGAARVMGFKLMTNFNRPYHARSISEFWKRWHISLSTWFRDYLYIPLGGNRVSIPRWYFNLFFVFLVSGLWHGANWTFVAWGALHGFYLIFAIVTAGWDRKALALFRLNADSRLYIAWRVVTTFILVMIAWTFFRANTIQDSIYIISQFPPAIKDLLHGLKAHSLWLGQIPVSAYELAMSFLLIVFLEAVHYAQEKMDLSRLIDKQPIYIRWPIYYAGIAATLGLGIFTNAQFIYFQF